MADLYKVLEIDRDANADAIKKAYRKLAVRWHPDKNTDVAAPKRFSEISAAYQILIDPEKRQAYDTYGDEIFSESDFLAPVDIFKEVFGNSGVFEQFFGGMVQSTRPKRGEDIKCIMEIELEETLTGCSRQTMISRMLTCEPCEGSGKTAQSKLGNCTVCKGSGKVNVATGFSFVHNCPNCGGKGTIVIDPCGNCRGVGIAKKDCEVTLHIPAGVSHQSRLRNMGGGDIGLNGGKPGNLYIHIEVVKHPMYEQKGKNIHGEINIPFILAVKGGIIEVPTLLGSLKQVPIPAGTQGGEYIVVENEGTLTLEDKTRGHMYLRVNIIVPRTLTTEKTVKLEKILQNS